MLLFQMMVLPCMLLHLPSRIAQALLTSHKHARSTCGDILGVMCAESCPSCQVETWVSCLPHVEEVAVGAAVARCAFPGLA